MDRKEKKIMMDKFKKELKMLKTELNNVIEITKKYDTLTVEKKDELFNHLLKNYTSVLIGNSNFIKETMRKL